MGDVTRTEVEAVVSPTGDLVVPSASVRRLALVPGEHVRVTVSSRRSGRNMYGVLAGRLPDVAPDDIAVARAEAWGELADGR